MKTIILIESAEELIKFANPTRREGDKTPFLGSSGTIVFENNMDTVQLQGVDGFELSEKIKTEDIIKCMARSANLLIHIT